MDRSQSIDQLLERYLVLLDEYRSLQDYLSKSMSAGFLSLAKANFSSSSRFRYGSNFFDERMQASRRVCIFEQSPPKTTQLAFSIHKNSQHSEEEDTPSPQNHPSSSSEDGTRDGEGPAETPDEEQKKSDPVDPLQWFGMIVPPALRATQSHFLEAVTDTIPKLVNTNQELKRVEAAIWKARKGRLQNQ